MLPFQGEREEMVWLVGVRGQSPIIGQKPPRSRGPNVGFGGGRKRGFFRNDPKTPFGQQVGCGFWGSKVSRN
jgi:hypothetical protein